MKDVLVLPTSFFLAGMTKSEMCVLGLMVAHADARGRCWPGQAGLSEKLATDRGRVTKTITSLEKKDFITRTKRGRANAYQIAEQFLVAPGARPQARAAHPGQQSMLLPIKGAKPAPIGTPHVSTGASSALINSDRTGVEMTPTGVNLTPGRESMKEDIPSPSTELDAAREESEEIREAMPVARFARPGAPSSSELVDGSPQRVPSNAARSNRGRPYAGGSARAAASDSGGAPERRVAWLTQMGQFVAATRPAEIEQYWLEAMKPPAEARAYLNRVDEAMRQSHWYRSRRGGGRAASLVAGGDTLRSPATPSDARVFRHVLASEPEGQAWDILARYAAGHAEGKAAIAAARRDLVARRAGKAAGALPGAAAQTPRRRGVRA